MKKIVILLIALVVFYILVQICDDRIITKKAQEIGTTFGIDVSQHQGVINWDIVSSQKKLPIQFVIVRATMGDDRKDSLFQKNFSEAKMRGFIVGSYHYYDPREEPIAQANNYITSIDTNLKAGDFIPILDIERISDSLPTDSLITNVKKWLDTVESRYKVKPVIYTSLHFYKKYLYNFSEYPRWIASYSQKRRSDSLIVNSAIHQFTENVRAPGVKGFVDGNDILNHRINDLLIQKPKLELKEFPPKIIYSDSGAEIK